ncbi:MAG: hypothetical protein QM398_06025, partial [Thermoproteota archaeon]|nr:hypothetical protein [Thermoproteota archaeon]
TQNIKTVKLDVAGFPEEITVFGKAAESTRSANPVLAALKGERLAYGKVGQYTRGISKTTIKTAGKTTTKPSTILQKDIVVDPAYIVDRAPLQMSTRKFTTMKASGLVDEAGTVDLAKSLPTGMAQEIYKKMGGGYKQLKASNYIQSLNEPKSSAMKVGSNKFFRENFVKQPKISTTSFAKPIQETKLSLKPTLKEVTLTRAILKVDSASKVKSVIPVIDAKPVLPAKTETKQVISAKEKQLPYPHRTSQQLRQIEDEEQVYLSYPGQQLRVETPTKTVVTPVLTPRSTYLQTSAVTLPTMTQIRTQPVTAPTKEKTKTPTLIRPITTPKTAPLTTPVITPWQTPKTAPYSTPFFGQTQKLTPKQMTTTALQFPPPATTKTLTAPAPFTPPFSHQKPRKRTRGIFGLWRKQDNPVKTSAAMLKTFGLLGSKKPVKSKRKKSRR